MNPKTEELLDRVFLFGVDTLKFLMTLPKEKVYGIVIYQLGKASTSSGSNYEEAQGAESPKDFNHKIGIVLKEIRESNYWFRVLNTIMLNSNNKELQRLLKESLELKKIFSVIKIKSENNLKVKLKSILKTFSIFHFPFSI
ncbi:MAG: four helix bundle protein [Ignavibacteria bacterium]